VTTIEARQLFVIRQPQDWLLSWCPGCAGDTTMVAPDVAASLCAVNTLTVYRWVEAGAVHFNETLEGRLFVCLNSLPQVDAEGALLLAARDSED
jgi:hypothetical protein